MHTPHVRVHVHVHVLLPWLTPKLLHTGRTPTLWRVLKGGATRGARRKHSFAHASKHGPHRFPALSHKPRTDARLSLTLTVPCAPVTHVPCAPVTHR
jgi:hypothetical protein